MLDLVPHDGWGRQFTPDELLNLDEYALAIEAFFADLVFVVNGVDLSWKDDVSMLHFGRQLFWSAAALSPNTPEQRFVSPDLVPTWELVLDAGDKVTIRRQYLDAAGKCPRAELVREAARFGIRVHDAFVAAYPAITRNAFFVQWYP
ncbi:MAG TPA: hypothetical protein VGC72_00520, partial [Candidatus Elarobacter sp.]